MEGSAGPDERFELRGELGVGASGAVYRVLDRTRGEEVALKTLRRVSGADLYRFKREFRGLAGVHHPNLATLHELFIVGNEWMFTMELVDGVRFDQWVRPSGVLDEARLREGMRQLADGLCALHALGKVHRDLKPSNVLVDRIGRTVILDFGLAVAPEHFDRTHEGGSVGTIAYMSPEQAADLPLTAATDWYSVGVMLYEGLTGERPIRGALHDVLMRKQSEDAPVVDLPAELPADLVALCARLLERDPENRPDDNAVMAALGTERSSATRAIEQRIAQRRSETCDPDALDALREAYAASRTHFVLVVVHGPRGSGKTALVDTFLQEVRRDGNALALYASDNAREQTPLPALDQAVDQLSTYLLGLSRRECEAIIHDAAPLARIFPALRRIPVLQLPTLPQGKATSPAEVLAAGISSLRRVLYRIGDKHPLVFAVDNGRGPREDRAKIVVDYFAGGEQPKMLMVTAMDPEAFEGNPLLTNFSRWRDEKGGDLRFIDLGASATIRSNGGATGG